MLNHEQLKMFILTSDLGSFSACAKKLGKVQSAVSQSIANLEIDLNITLFDRSTRKPQLTADGSRLYDYAKAIIYQYDEFSSAVLSIQQKQETEITFAIDNLLMTASVTKLLKNFSLDFPMVKFNLLVATSSKIATLVKEQQADIGLMFANPEFLRDVELCHVGNMPFIGVCNTEHPLANKTIVRVSDLIEHREILLTDVHEDQSQNFTAFSPEQWTVNTGTEAKLLVIEGIGWSYLPEHLVKDDVERGKLIKLNLSFDHKSWGMSVECVTQKNAVIGMGHKKLVQELKNIFE
jgi:DNA-binding transcriptional LysR family regulator